MLGRETESMLGRDKDIVISTVPQNMTICYQNESCMVSKRSKTGSMLRCDENIDFNC